MEIPPYPPEDKVTQVWNIFHQKDGVRPTVVSCSSKETLQHQVVQIIMNSKSLDSHFKAAIEAYIGAGLFPNFERIVTTFRMAQLSNNISLGFDMWWDEEPQVLL